MASRSLWLESASDKLKKYSPKERCGACGHVGHKIEYSSSASVPLGQSVRKYIDYPWLHVECEKCGRGWERGVVGTLNH